MWGRSQTLEYLASTLTAQNVIKHHPETVMTDEWLTVILLECYSVLLFCRSAVLLFVAAGCFFNILFTSTLQVTTDQYIVQMQQEKEEDTQLNILNIKTS